MVTPDKPSTFFLNQKRLRYEKDNPTRCYRGICHGSAGAKQCRTDSKWNFGH
jgi:hypothetical protein